MKILLVAEHPSVAAQIRQATDGWQDTAVFQVATPQRALAILDGDGTGEGEDDYDVVIADNDTHPTGGLALCREVKARGQMGREVPPVVLLIARVQDKWLSNWAQADAYVLKPADPFDLREALGAVAAGDPLPALPGIGGEPKPSLLDPRPDAELAASSGVVGRSDEGLPDELPAQAHGSDADAAETSAPALGQ